MSSPFCNLFNPQYLSFSYTQRHAKATEEHLLIAFSFPEKEEREF